MLSAAGATPGSQNEGHGWGRDWSAQVEGLSLEKCCGRSPATLSMLLPRKCTHPQLHAGLSSLPAIPRVHKMAELVKKLVL